MANTVGFWAARVARCGPEVRAVGGDGQKLYEHMLRKGVIVRPMQAYGYPSFIRITVGRETENQRFVRALGETLQDLGYGN